MKHAKFSPSSLHRTVRCHASYALSRDIPRTTSRYADEGTAAAALADLCLKAGQDTDQHIGLQLMVGDSAWPVTEEMATHVQTYLEIVRDCPGSIHAEVAVPLEHLTGEEGARGYADAIVLGDGIIDVLDLKYGKGEPVSVINNEQMMGYLSGALKMFGHLDDYVTFRMTIVQPRIGNIASQVVTLAEIEAFERDVMDACNYGRAMAKLLDQTGCLPNEAYNPGQKQCRWCPARFNCTARAAEAVGAVIGAEVTQADLTDLLNVDLTTTAVPAMGITPDEREQILDMIPFIKDWIADQQHAAEKDALSGVQIPGYKLVQGRNGPRKWTNALLAGELMAQSVPPEQMYHQDLISPTEAEKLLKKADPALWASLQDTIGQTEGKPTLVPSFDKRPSIQIDVSDLLTQEA